MAGRALKGWGTELLFRCATDPPERALESWRIFLSQISLDDVAGPQFRLIPAVCANLSRVFDDFPEKGRVKGIYRYTWAKNARLRKACQVTIGQLTEHGVETLVLKGVVLNSLVYQDLGLRPAADFDLLVKFGDAERGLEILLNQGWTIKDRVNFSPPSQRLEQAVALEKDGLELDFHWFALREARNPHSDDALWQRAVDFDLGGVMAKTLCPTDLLFHLLVNATREPENAYRFLLDLKVFRQRFEGQYDVEEVFQLLRERHLLHRLHYIPLAEAGFTELCESPRPGLFDRFWSWCSRYINDGTGEWIFGFFPFPDYYLHHRGSASSSLSFGSYLQGRLQVKSWRDFIHRTLAKVKRTLF